MDVEDLIGKVADGFERYQHADADRIAAALDTGAALIELRERLPHGDFLPAIRRLGIADRTARDWMRLVRAGMKTATVADLGGIRAALEEVRQRAKTADDVRRQELVFENVELKRQLGDKLATATPEQLEQLEQLEQYAILLRTQDVIAEARNRMNELITENEALKQERTALEKRRESLRASIAIQSP